MGDLDGRRIARGRGVVPKRKAPVDGLPARSSRLYPGDFDVRPVGSGAVVDVNAAVHHCRAVHAVSVGGEDQSYFTQNEEAAGSSPAGTMWSRSSVDRAPTLIACSPTEGICAGAGSSRHRRQNGGAARVWL